MRAFCYCLAFFGMTSVCTLKYQKLSVLPSHRKLDGTCGFTTFTRFFLLWRCYLWRHLPTKQCSVFSTNLWLWSQMELNPSLTLSRRAIFRSDPFQKQARYYLEWGELMIADASGGGGGGYTWGPLGSPCCHKRPGYSVYTYVYECPSQRSLNSRLVLSNGSV